MKWWTRFWKRRKQDDRIKIMLLFFIGVIGFFADAVNSGIQVYNMMRSPVEYVVSNSSASGLTSYQMSGIETMEDIQAVSRQRESSLTLSESWGEMTVTCLELSDDYLALAYGMSETGAMKVIYLNGMAWNQLMQASGEIRSESEQADDISENETEQADSLQLDYKLGEEEITGTAWIVYAKSGVPNDTACAFCDADSVRLSEGESGVRIQMKGQDLDGTTVKQLGQLGLEVVNSGDIQQNSLKQEMQFLRMRYAVIAALLCLAALVSLKKYGRRIEYKK